MWCKILINFGVIKCSVHCAALMVFKMQYKPILKRLIRVGHPPKMLYSESDGFIEAFVGKAVFVKHTPYFKTCVLRFSGQFYGFFNQ